MENIVRNVRDIAAGDRPALEHVVGQALRENQQLIIQIVNIDLTSPPTNGGTTGVGGLPEWCNVYEGLSDEEITDLEKSIVRSHESRSFT